jgi:hypothetical protein
MEDVTIFVFNELIKCREAYAEQIPEPGDRVWVKATFNAPPHLYEVVSQSRYDMYEFKAVKLKLSHKQSRAKNARKTFRHYGCKNIWPCTTPAYVLKQTKRLFS